MDQPDTSDVLRELLVRQGMRAGSVGAGRAKGLASAPVNGEENRKRRHSPTAGGGGIQPMGIRLVISNRREPTRSKAGKPLPGVGSHLMLVWSDGHLVTRRPLKARQ